MFPVNRLPGTQSNDQPIRYKTLQPSWDHYIPFLLIPFVGWGVRHYLLKNNDFTPLKKTTLGIALAAYFTTEMARSFYRPFIYTHEVNDWVIADTIGNSTGTVTAIFMILTMSGRGKKSDWWLVGMVVTGLLTYELLNIASNQSLDINDLLATIIFGSISSLWYAYLLKRNKSAHQESLKEDCIIAAGKNND